jgi:hypothetical protein
MTDVLAAVIVLYTALAAEFLIRYTLDRPMGRYGETGGILSRGALDTRMRYVLMAMSATVLFLLTRSVYRMIELSGGWDGKVFSTQWLFSSFTIFLPLFHNFGHRPDD